MTYPTRNDDGTITVQARATDDATGTTGDGLLTLGPGDGGLYDRADASLRASDSAATAAPTEDAR
jgi:hypothetical protein